MNFNSDMPWVLFTIDKETFAISAEHVLEMVVIQHIIKIPQAPDYIRGVLKLRDRTFPVMDLRVKMGIDQSAKALSDGSNEIAIVLEVGNRSMVVCIDTVSTVEKLSEADMSEMPEVLSTSVNQFLLGIAKRESDKSIVQLLDAAKLIGLKPEPAAAPTPELEPVLV